MKKGRRFVGGCFCTILLRSIQLELDYVFLVCFHKLLMRRSYLLAKKVKSRRIRARIFTWLSPSLFLGENGEIFVKEMQQHIHNS